MRIASLAPSATIMLQELGVADQIVACTYFCPLPPVERQAKAIGSFSVLHEEKLAATKPDLVITATKVQAQGQARLTAAGFKVLHLDPCYLLDIATTYAELGSAIGKAAAGKRLQENFLHQLQRLPVPSSTVPKIYMEEWHEPPFVSGNWVPDIVTKAGGQSVLSHAGQPSHPITLAALQQADPDIIIQHVCLPPGRSWTHHRRRLSDALCQRPGWHNLRAVQTGQVYPLDDTPFNMPTQGVLQGVSLLRALLQAISINKNYQIVSGAVDKF